MTTQRVAKSRGHLARILVLLLGVLPATILAVPAILLLLSSIDRAPDVRMILGLSWSIAAIGGMSAGWVYVARYDRLSQSAARVLFAAILGGVVAALCAAIVLWSYSSGLSKYALLLPAAVGAAAALHCGRIGWPSSIVPAACLAGALLLSVLAPTAAALMRTEVDVLRPGVWECGTFGTCEEFVSVRLDGDMSTRRLVTQRGMVNHLEALDSDAVTVTIKMQCFLGRFAGYRIVDISGFRYELENQFRTPIPGATCEMH